MTNPIYLDYNATTPIAREVAEAMVPYLYEHFGNPSSSHPYGIATKRAVETARTQVAALLGCQSVRTGRASSPRPPPGRWVSWRYNRDRWGLSFRTSKFTADRGQTSGV